MAKSAFDDNVPRVRPRLRLGKALGELESNTEPPPLRPREEALVVEPAPEPVVIPEPPIVAEPVTPYVAEPVVAPVEPPEPEHNSMGVPAVGEASALPEEPAPELFAEAAAWAQPESVPVEDAGRRASLKKRAAGLGTLPEEPPSAVPTAILDELDALESTAELAGELQRALDAAADANEQLRVDLSAALDDLARSTAESRRLHERLERVESEARERSRVVHDLVRELELLEAERDSALVQASDSQLELESQADEKLLLERRVHELERSLADAQARTKRFEEAAKAHAAQRSAIRVELEGIRRERDTLHTRNAELEREREELGRSRKALDEVHRALSEARSRAQRIRPR